MQNFFLVSIRHKMFMKNQKQINNYLLHIDKHILNN